MMKRVPSAIAATLACSAIYIFAVVPFAAAQEEAPPARVLTSRMHLGEDGLLYLREQPAGSWTSITDGLPRHPVYPFDELRPVRLTSASHAPGSHTRMVATSGTHVYLRDLGNDSANSGDGSAWREIAHRSTFGTYAYLTASAVSPTDPDHIVVGTSFHGLHMSTDGGETWQDISAAFDNLRRGAHYVDDFAALSFDPAGRTLFAAVRLGTELYALDLDTRRRRRLSIPSGEVQEISLTPQGGIEMRTAPDDEIFGLDPAAVQDSPDDETGSASNTGASGPGGWRRLAEASTPQAAEAASASTAEESRRRTAADRYGMFVPFLQARGERLEEHIDFAQRHGINAFVIDFKDDQGRLTYDSELELPQQVGAVRNYIDIDALSARLDEAGIYLIARVVVFKDEHLYRHDGGRLAIRDSRTGDPWGHRVERTDRETGESVIVQREHWVDPFSSEVWQYNVAIAEELADHGVDEIQFDYIRFPSDGPVRRMAFAHRRSGMRRVDALASFLSMARERIDIPIGTDVFGFNGWYEMDYLGQNIAMIARHVDVISPMYYPSHFDSRFLGDRDFYRRARDIYGVGSARARIIVDDRALIRPYVQSFLIGSELELERPEYARYLTEQIEGSLSAGTRGFLLWNFSGRYYMVADSLRQYTRLARTRTGGDPGDPPVDSEGHRDERLD